MAYDPLLGNTIPWFQAHPMRYAYWDHAQGNGYNPAGRPADVQNAGYSPFSWFNPRSDYGGTFNNGYTGNSWAMTPAGQTFMQNNPGTYFDRQTMPFASGNDPFSQFVRSRAGQFEQGYRAAGTVNPNLTAEAYGRGIGNGLSEDYFRKQFNWMAPNQRGESASNLGGGRLRWIS